MALPKHKSYIESNVPDLGEIPAHWKVIRNRFLFQEQNERSLDGKETHLCMSQKLGLVPSDEFEDKTLQSESYEGARLCKKGDLVLNRLKAHLSVFSTAPCDGLVSPDYSVFRLRDSEMIPKYFEHLFKTPVYLSEFNRRVRGIVAGFYRLYTDDFNDVRAVCPPIEDQKRIIDFLDRKTSEIDQAIAQKQRLIELLQEQKAILINQAVTKGLNPNVPMRDSGIDWVSQIPCHWKKTKLKHCINLLPGFAFKSTAYSNNKEDVPLLRGININPGMIRWDETVYWSKEKIKGFTNYLLREDDIVIGMDRPWISSGIRVARIRSQDLPCLLLQRVARIRAIKPLTQNYLELILRSNGFLAYFEPMLTGISVPHISPEQIKNFEFFMPDQGEQESICDFVSQISQDFMTAEKYESKAIEALEELKSVVISEAVTGKIKV